MNIGDVLYQVFMFAILLGIMFAIYYFIRGLVNKMSGKHTVNSDSRRIEEKLDRIIEILEKEKRS